MTKILPISFLVLVVAALPLLTFATGVHFNLDASTYTVGQDIIFTDSDPSCHGVGCAGQSNGWAFYNDATPGSLYAECGNWSSGSYSANCTKILEPGESTPTAGNYSAIARPGLGSCSAKTYSDCADDGGVEKLISFSVLAAETSAPLFTLPTNTAADLTANVSDTLGDVGTLAVVVAAIAFPLLFWVMHKIKDTMPGSDPRIGKLKKDIAAAEGYAREERNFIKGFGKIGKK